MNRNILSLLLIILSVGLYFTVTRGMIADAQAVKAVNDQYTSALNNAANLSNILTQVDAQWNSISADDRTKIDEMLPSSVDNIRLIIDLNNIAVRHGFSLSGVRAVAPDLGSASAAQGTLGLSASTPTLDKVQVTFGATAPYSQFISFLQDLEINLRVMDITDLSLSASDSGNYSFQVGLQTYWMRQ
jgi:hypothetical protein